MIETRKLYAQYLSIKRNQDKVIEEIKLLQLEREKKKTASNRSTKRNASQQKVDSSLQLAASVLHQTQKCDSIKLLVKKKRKSYKESAPFMLFIVLVILVFCCMETCIKGTSFPP